MTAAAPPSVSPPATGSAGGSVTGVFVRLKLSLMRNGLRQSRGRTVGWCIGVGLTMLYALANGAGMIALRGNHYAPAVSVTVAVVLGVGWAVMPLFFFGGDDTLDPTRLAMLPLRPRPLLTALLTSSLVGVGPLFTLLLAAGAVTAVAHGPAAVVVSALSVALLLVLCVALSRAIAAANTRLLTSRRGRDLALLSGLFVAVGAQLVNLGLSSLSGTDGLHRATSAASVLRWIPPATAVDAVRSTGRGAYGLAAVQLAVTVAATALVLRWWHRSLFRLMVSPDASTIAAAPEASGGRDRSAGRSPLGLRLPSGRTGTVMQRQFRYMWRDPRAKAALATGLAVGLLLPLVAVVQHGTVYQCLWAAGLLGIQMYNQFGLDGSAFWTVMATIADRRDAEAELRGRALAIAVIAVPYVTVVTTGAAVLLGQADALAETLGLSFAFTGALVATGGFASVRYPYAVPRDNPFSNAAPGQSGLVMINVFGGTLTGAALCLPVLGPVVALHLTGHHGLLWLALPVGALYGAALAALALRFTAPRLLDRLPEILATVRK
ncbi:transporter [Actinacidiphila bryophytorum]|uniref:ABC-2 type transport system permease protein n=1 Tax=Actinacidiphila bryophytorum TaxID=1436133 RepID=A0A9W4H0Q6_9ACTN|nr:transporter [Actinacidiphila bryophytorum]MBM9439410.1 transporter [Actinacidiphila bryophytorum]MBN6546878.1 transporter [Actinacidiphila bryophytorum]CAG7639031.1 ABC-2 type transport system permease protein [Actinacidiphila bryophytorum]